MRLAHALFACAALLLSLGPSVDAMAGAAKIAVESGRTGAVVTAVAALDLIDDTLDHLPGKSGGEQQQLIVPPLSPAAAPEVTPSVFEADGGWIACPVRALASCPSENPKRPPRA